MQISYEITDTFSGEANYSWVRRGEISVDMNASWLSIVRKIKKEVGWNGIKCHRTDYGDMIALQPYGVCQVMFIF